MIFLSVLAKTYAITLGMAHPVMAAACWVGGMAADLLFFRHWLSKDRPRVPELVWNMGWANAGSLILGIAAQELMLYAAMRWKGGLPGLSILGGWLLRALGIPVASFGGETHLTTMVGPLSFAVSLDNLALALPVVMAAIFGAYLFLTLSDLRTVLRRLVGIVGLLLALSLIRWVVSTALFVGLCDFVSYESEELPWGPFLKSGMIGWTYLPLFLGIWPLMNVLLPSVPPRYAPAASPNRWVSWGWWPILGMLLLTAFWKPQGTLKSGKVLINTFHTQWSRTDRPYDREWYGADSGYNYACLKRWYEAFYDVRELKTRLKASDLDGVSILIIYLPDVPFTDEERQVITEFVQRGGGLLLIGDHTNVFGSTSHLNPICEPFGFIFRDDVLFDLDEDFFQLLDVGRLRSPLLHGMTFFKFRGPTSIQPTSLFARPVMWLDHAKSVRAIYSVNNFYPPPHDHPAMTSGRFCVSVASYFGQGRVLAFADSTIFSNFEIFYPGKYEYLLNAGHWLNHADTFLGTFLRRGSLVLAAVLLVWVFGRIRQPQGWLYAIASILVAIYLIRGVTRVIENSSATFPNPIRPLQALFFAADATDESYVLRAFTSQAPYDQRYDVFIQWVLRTGVFSGFYVTGSGHYPGLYEHLSQQPQSKTGLALIVRGTEQLELLRKLMGGPEAECPRWLIMFSQKLDWEVLAKTLAACGIAREASEVGQARSAWPSGEVVLDNGKRRVLLVFSAERYSDQAMGFSEKVVPDPSQRMLFDKAFSLIDRFFEGKGPMKQTKP